MGCCGEASTWAKIGVICVICAFCLQTAAYVTNNWMVYNTVKDEIDVRVGLWWFTNCSADISCYTISTPSSYKSLFFYIAQGLEGGTALFLLVTAIIYCSYVLADSRRTKCVAATLIVLLLITVLCSGGGLALWILQIDYPYFLAWSGGMSAVATALSVIGLLCLIPDIKEYPYYKLEITPVKRHRPQMFYTKHGPGNKGGADITRDSNDFFKGSNGFGQEYGDRDLPSSKEKRRPDDEDDRFSLNVVTPSQPPRADYFNRY